MESKKLYLDDIRFPHLGNPWIIVRNYKEFIEWIQTNGLPDEISFDHDLADIHYDPHLYQETFSYYEETGYDAAKWLCEYCQNNGLKLPKCYVHSANPTGAENIMKYINNYKIHVENTEGDCYRTSW